MKWYLLTTILFFASKIFSQDLSNPDQHYYDFHPMSTLSLGQSFDPNHIGDAKISPINFIEKKIDLKDDKAALTTYFDAYLVTNKEQLKWAFSFDSKMSARVFKMKANSSFSFLNNFQFKKNSIYLVINARSEFSRSVIDEIQFTDLAKRFVEKPKRFEEIFGSRIVTMVRKGAAVWLLISIDDASQSLLNRIRYSVSGSGKFGPIKGSMEATVQNEIRWASSQGRLSIQLVTNGGVGLGDYDGIVAKLSAAASDFKALKDEIAKSIFSKINYDNAAPIGFHSTSVKSLGVKKGWKLREKVISAEYESLLTSIIDFSEILDDKQLELNEIFNGKNTKSQLLSQKQLDSIQTYFIPKIDSIATLIHDIHTEVLFRYDDIDETTFEPEIKFVKTKKSQLESLKKINEKLYPYVESLLSIQIKSSQIEIISKKIESISFRVYYDEVVGGNITPRTLDFSDLCLRTIQEGVLRQCGRDETPSTVIWGRLDKVLIDTTNFFNTNRRVIENVMNTLRTATSIDNSWNLLLVIKTPFFGETEILVGKLFLSRPPAYFGGLFFDTYLIPKDL